jgi:undecaprenyl-phosphate galactose phosphotransferase
MQSKEAVSIRKRFAKRCFDVVFGVAILIGLSPFLLSIYILIRSTSKGPALYKGLRLGRGGKVIGCWKFRTMYEDADERLQEILAKNEPLRREWQAFQKLKNDPRVTPLGRFLRKLSLDELPQFWNVLKGDLSVVGPRPPIVGSNPSCFHLEIRRLYGEWTDLILSVRPGITGLWQVSGRSHVSFETRIQMDIAYISSHSFWSDLWIILQTIPAVLRSRGAF